MQSFVWHESTTLSLFSSSGLTPFPPEPDPEHGSCPSIVSARQRAATEWRANYHSRFVNACVYHPFCHPHTSCRCEQFHKVTDYVCAYVDGCAFFWRRIKNTLGTCIIIRRWQSWWWWRDGLHFVRSVSAAAYNTPYIKCILWIEAFAGV